MIAPRAGTARELLRRVGAAAATDFSCCSFTSYAQALRYYSVRHWNTATAAERCHADPEAQTLTAAIYQVARITQVVNGIRRPDPTKLLTQDRRARLVVSLCSGRG